MVAELRVPVRSSLADGREIFYVDDVVPPRPRAARDTRPIEAVHTHSEVRFDPLLEQWSTLASHRQDRTFLPSAADCPLCPSRPGQPTEVPEGAFDVVAFENRFPSLSGHGGGPPVAEPDLAQPGIGRCEVVVPTDVHGQTVPDLSLTRMRTLVDTWAFRSAALAARPDVAAVAVFENRGRSVGVTLSHTHQQIYAYPFLPPVTARLDRAQRRAREVGAGCLVCRRLEVERAGERVVLTGEYWTVVVPFAARWPYEVQVIPHRHVRELAELDTGERDELASVWRELFTRYDRLFPARDHPDRSRGAATPETVLPTISAWHQAPRASPDGHLLGQAFSLARDVGKLKYLAGSESAFGAWILDVTPERAAQALRDAARTEKG